MKDPCTPQATFDYGKLRSLTVLGVNVLDKVLDIGYGKQPLDAHRKAVDDWRAIGLGVMGLADMFTAMGIRYGSAEGCVLLSTIFKEIRDTALYESAMLAKSFGAFGKFDAKKVLASDYFLSVSDFVKGAIKEYGLRNGNLISVAPSGLV